MSWKCLPCTSSEIQLLGTLNGGQSFRWKHNADTDEWTGVFASTLWQLLQTESGINYKVLGSLKKANIVDGNLVKNERNKKKKIRSVEGAMDGDYFEGLLKKYLRLDVKLGPLYDDWSEKDPIFKKAAEKFFGIRMLDQEPVENLFSFICSQNNHISRISSMIEKLCCNYGEVICEYGGAEYYSFPTVQSISHQEVDSKLRELGFGYRAKFIQQSAAKISEWGDTSWFDSLKEMPYSDAKKELIKLPGIGAKVADCICLMSLNHLEAVPVDTHVYQIASENYLHHLKGLKSVTEKVYNEIGDHFRNLYGPLAGWAHTVLFCADLKKFEQPGSKRISSTIKGTKIKKKCTI